MKTLLVAFALLAKPVPAPDPFCADVAALAAGAAEAEPFRTLRERDFRPRLLRRGCFFSSAGGYTCTQNLSRPDETSEGIAARIAACLPGAALTRRRIDYADYLVVTRGRFEARVDERGTDRAHVGRSIIIYIAARPLDSTKSD